MRRRLFQLVFAGLLILPRDIRAEWLDTGTLTNIAARHRLPQPPDNARLVLSHTESWRMVKRSSVGLRMEMLEPLPYPYIAEKNRARRLALLAVFLNDKTVRNDARQSAKYDGPCAAFKFHKISVQNFAAMQIASILELPDSPDEFWTSKDWEKLRKEVEAGLIAEKLPDFTAK